MVGNKRNNVFYNIPAANSPTTPPELWNWSAFKILMQIQCDRYTTVTMKNIGKSPKFWNFKTRCEKKYLESDFAHSQSCKGPIDVHFSSGFNSWIEISHDSRSRWSFQCFKNLVSPYEVLESPDGRKLGILIKNIKITPVWYSKT